MRTIVDIPDAYIRILAEIARKSKVSRAEIIRAALANYIAKHNNKIESYAQSFGAWKNCEIDGVEFQKKIREEW